MNQIVEDYLKLAVGQALESRPDIQPENIITGTSGMIQPPDDNAILCLADDIEGVVGPLSIANVKLIVRTPSLLGDRDEHRALASEVRDLARSLPSAESLGAPGLTVNGSHLVSFNTTSADGPAWVTTIEVKVGVMEL